MSALLSEQLHGVQRYPSVCVCVCVCACLRACVRVHTPHPEAKDMSVFVSFIFTVDRKQWMGTESFASSWNWQAHLKAHVYGAAHFNE